MMMMMMMIMMMMIELPLPPNCYMHHPHARSQL
jgi:hypothetical protein